VATTGIYDLDKNLITSGFLDGNASVTVGITNQTNPTALRKISTNEELGTDEFVVDNIEAKAGAQASDITFLNGGGQVGFQASGDLFAELAVFPDPTGTTFSAALGPVADTKFTLQSDPDRTVVMLRWGADAAASGSGGIALGGAAGTVNFSAGLAGNLFFCVLQQVPCRTPTDDALKAVVKSWRLPAQVRTPDDLAPRTHLLAEVGGSLTASISATFGHEFNWIRQINDGAIAGDIGLKLELGLKATFNLTAQGKYAIVVSRESEDAVIRVRIYKLKLNGFDFALSASAAATPCIPLPDNFTDLVKATLGLHAQQILSELENPNAINDWINKFGPEYVTELLKKFTGLDLAAAMAKVNDLATRWKALPSSAASLFVKLAEKDIPDFSEIEQAAQIVANKDGGGLKALLESRIQDLHLPLLDSPLGQYLEGIAELGPLSLLQNIPDAAQQAAQKAVAFFKGDPIEELLHKIVSEIDGRLGLDAVLAVIQGDPAAVLDKLLFSKLEAFLNRTPTLQDVQALQKTIQSLLKKSEDLYGKTVTALNNTYTATLNSTYQQTTSDTALIDATFDFGLAANGPGVASALQQLLAGRLDDFLIKPRAGVTLNNGALTHLVKRHSHVDLTLPFLKLEGDWLSNATASFNAIDQNGGRLTTYQLSVTGTQVNRATFTSLWMGRNWRSTAIALSGQLSAKLGFAGTVRMHAETDAEKKRLATSTSSIRLEVASMTLNQLDAGIEPFAVQFLRRAFPDNSAFEKWAATGRLLAQPGNTLVALDVSLPAAVPLAWLNNTISDKKDAVYKELSLTLQLLLKRYLKDYYFRDISRYENQAPAYLVLLYAAIPPAGAITVGGSSSSVDDGIYWDTDDMNAIRGMANQARDSESAQGFKAQLAQAQTRLVAAGRNDLARFFDPSDGMAESFKEATSDANLGLLKNSLLFVEGNVISAARDAALLAATFNALVAANQPVDALKALASFGNKIVEAFNHDLSSVFVQDNDALQRLSPLIFAQAASVFDPSISTTNYDSTLNVTVLKPGVAMPTNFPDFTVAPGDILVSLNAASFGLEQD
jgi:hypothetical protein